MVNKPLEMPEVGDLPTSVAIPRKPGAVADRDSAEQQIATVDEQLTEMQGNIDVADMQLEALEEAIRQRKKFINGETKRMEKLKARRSVFIDAVASLRKLERS